MRTLFSQLTYNIFLIINILLVAGLIYVHQQMCKMTDEKEQKIAWQTLNNTIEKADFFFDRNETSCVEMSKFALSLEKDTALLYQTLTQLMQDNRDLRAAFICFYDSTRNTNAYLMRDKNHIVKSSCNDYISELKQKSLQERFEKNNVQSLWENSIISLSENQAHINLFVPFFDKTNRQKGFVGFNISLASIDTLLRSELTYYEKDAFAFMFMLTSDGIAVGTAGNVIDKNDHLLENTHDEAFLSTLYNMRNGETASEKVKIPVIQTENMVFYKSLTNKKISVALSYHENQSMKAWKRLFIIIMGALMFFFIILTLWFWYYWKKRAQTIDAMSDRLSEIGKGATNATLPSSPLHSDLEELCTGIENMQKGLILKNREMVNNAESDERKNHERKLSQSIRRYFYSPSFQCYDASLSQKIQQYVKTNYLPDIGGDFHDYFNISQQLICFVTGTVTRPKKNISNIQTAMDILMTMTLLRSHLKAYSSLSRSVFNLNNDLYSQNNGNFTVSFFIGVINCETNVLEFISAGAPTHYMISHHNIFPVSVQHGLPLASRYNEEYSTGTKELFNGDMLMIHTVGVTSRQNATSHEYGQPRLQKTMTTANMKTPDLFVKDIVKDITVFTDTQRIQIDDYTLFAIKYEGKEV